MSRRAAATNSEPISSQLELQRKQVLVVMVAQQLSSGLRAGEWRFPLAATQNPIGWGSWQQITLVFPLPTSHTTCI